MNSKLYLIIAIVFIAKIQTFYCEETETTKALSEPKEAEKEAKKNDFTLVRFMDFKRDEFLEILPKLKSVLASQLSTFCSKLEIACTSTELKNLTSENIDFVGNTIKEKFVEQDRFIVGKLFAFVKDEFSKMELFPEKTIESFLTESRNKIAEEANVDIAYINDKLVYPKRNNLDNYIIIPITLALVLCLVVLNFICQKKKQKQYILELTEASTKRNEKISRANDSNEPQGFPLERKESYENQPMIEDSTYNKGGVKFTEV